MESTKKRKGPLHVLLLRALPISIAVSLTCEYGLNLYFNNVSYETKDGDKIFSKVDGLFNYTEIKMYNNGSINVNRFRFLGTTECYTVENKDQNVDRIIEISVGRGGHSTVFNKKEDLQKYPIKFEQANKDFTQQLERFNLYHHK